MQVSREALFPAGLGTLIQIKSKAYARMAFGTPFKAFISAILLFLYFFELWGEDIWKVHEGTQFQPFWGYATLVTFFGFVCACLPRPLSHFYSTETQWIAPAPWSRRDKAVYVVVRRLLMLTLLALVLAPLYGKDVFQSFTRIYPLILLSGFVPLGVIAAFNGAGIKVPLLVERMLCGALALLIFYPIAIFLGRLAGLDIPTTKTLLRGMLLNPPVQFFQSAAVSYFSGTGVTGVKWTAFFTLVLVAAILACVRSLSFNSDGALSAGAAGSDIGNRFRERHSGLVSRRFELRLPNFPSLGGAGSIAWLLLQGAARMYRVPAQLFIGMLVFEAFLATDLIIHKPAKLQFVGGGLSLVPLLIGILVSWIFTLTTIGKIERLKSLPISNGNLVIGLATPIFLILLFSMTIELILRTAIATHFNVGPAGVPVFLGTIFFLIIPFAISNAFLLVAAANGVAYVGSVAKLRRGIFYGILFAVPCTALLIGPLAIMSLEVIFCSLVWWNQFSPTYMFVEATLFLSASTPIAFLAARFIFRKTDASMSGV